MHLDDLALDQLDAIVLVQDPGLGHAQELVGAEAPARDLGLDLCRHALSASLASSIVRWLTPW